MSEWLWLDDVRARARALGASGHALGEILHRAVVNGRIQRITGLFAKAPIERIREHWPADAALLQWVATWTIPGDLAELLLTRASGPFGIEPGNRLRAMIMWGDGAPPYEADTCVFANVRLCWPEVAGELAAAGFVLPPEWDPIASPREQPQIALAAHEANAAIAPPEPEPLKPAPSTVIDQAITAAYDAAKAAQQKPPNVNEIIKPVQETLRSRGYSASGQQIERRQAMNNINSGVVGLG